MGNLDDELEGSQRQGQGLWIHAVPMASHTSCRFDAVDPNGAISEDHASVSAKQFHICQGYALGRTHLFVSCNSLSFVAWNVWSFFQVVGTLKTLSPRVGPTLSSNRFAIMTVVWFFLCLLSTLVSRLFCRKTEAGRTCLVRYSPPALFKLQPSNVL